MEDSNVILWSVGAVCVTGLLALVLYCGLSPEVCSYEVSGNFSGVVQLNGSLILNNVTINNASGTIKFQMFCRDIEAAMRASNSVISDARAI